MAAGQEVELAEPLTRIPNIPVFSVGFWNGLYHSPAMLHELALNFKRFSNYKPHGSINHEDILAAGRVADVRFDGRTLFIDLCNVPKSVAQAWNAKQLHSPSIEYWDTRNDQDSRLMAGFRLPNGQSPGLVLRAVTLCGNQPPAVKNLGPMPKAVYESDSYTVPSSLVPKFEDWQQRQQQTANRFSDLAPATRRFSHEDRMDKTAMIASLKAADASLTDEFLAMLDENQLAALLDAKQGAAASNAVDVATPGMDPGAGGAGGPMAGPPSIGAGGPMAGDDAPPDPDKIMQDCGGDSSKAMAKMMRDSAAWMNRQQAKNIAAAKNIMTLEGQLQQIKAKAAGEHATIVNDRISRFMDEVASKRVPPYQMKSLENRLRALDAAVVRKFSDGSNKTGSALDEEMATIASWPVDHRLMRKFSDASAAKTVSPGGKASGLEKIERAAEVLGSTPEGALRVKTMRERYAAVA